MHKNLLLALFTAMSVILFTSQSFAVVVGSDNFDGGGNFTSRVITPDNSGNFGFGGAPGVFPGSFFDLFGITNRAVLFDVADDSAGTFAPDDFGIIPTAKLDSFFALTDLANPDNPGGTGSITWNYTVTGHQNLTVSLDLAAIGNFDTADDFVVTAQIDAGPTQTIFNIQHASGIQYGVTMEGGVTYDRYNSAFYSQTEYDTFCPAGPGTCVPTDPNTLPAFNFHSFDLDMDGLVALQDGSLERGYEVTNVNGTFDEIDHELYIDPLAVNATPGDFDVDGDVDGDDFLLWQRGETTSPLSDWEANYGASGAAPVLLNNDLQTVTVPVSGTGTTLTLTFTAAQNSSKEVFAMDNLSINGDVIPLSAVPEPTTVVLFGLGLAIAPIVRRRKG